MPNDARLLYEKFRTQITSEGDDLEDWNDLTQVLYSIADEIEKGPHDSALSKPQKMVVLINAALSVRFNMDMSENPEDTELGFFVHAAYCAATHISEDHYKSEFQNCPDGSDINIPETARSPYSD